MKRILAINPNSNPDVTQGMAQAVSGFKNMDGVQIDCIDLPQGPYGIQSQADIEAVSLPLRQAVLDQPADAYVIACYSDPGLHVCREATSQPVIGIQEAAVTTAMARAERFGVIALSPASIARHRRALRQMGVLSRLAGERSVELTVAQTASGENTLERLLAIGRELRDLDGANVLILGCAGMAKHRRPLQQALQIPVIDPVQAAVTIAIGSVAL